MSAVPLPDSLRGQLVSRSLAATARRHWLIIALLGGGLALRLIAQLAYRPLLLYVDSYVYLANLHHLDPTGDYPIGYDLFLRPILWLGNLAVVAGIQHLLGLGMGLAIYLLLQRRGVRPWLSALAAAPVLLDAYQVQIEQNLMADTLFEALLVAAVAVLTWRRRPGYGAAAGAGALLGAAVLVRLVGEPLVIPAVVFVAIVGSGRWRRAGLALALAAAFAVPVGAYAGYYHSRTGKLGISAVSGGALYGRVVGFAECEGLRVPSYERILCPTWPRGKRPTDSVRAGAKLPSPRPSRIETVSASTFATAASARPSRSKSAVSEGLARGPTEAVGRRKSWNRPSPRPRKTRRSAVSSFTIVRSSAPSASRSVASPP